ncbi:MAG: helix-turn-helix transcriptional regulator [Henriciella sp.]
MLHNDIWRGLDLLAEQNGLSVSGLARRAGLDATAFNKSKRTAKDGRPRWPSTESISRALVAVNAEFGDFAAIVTGGRGQTIPLLAYDDACAYGAFDQAGHPAGPDWEDVLFPGADIHKDLYAIEVTGPDMAPIYRAGDRIIVSASAEARTGDRVAVKLQKGKLFAAVLACRSEGRVELQSLAVDGASRTLRAGELAWIARILWVSQ